ncbi:hypothetical protein ILUMI_11171 [Ignelater luminosus]|uniref:Nucleoplasmin core domain-containing protein n=1 Tax=Ignelater luminosus TaxID=2038154 RepID=A0A8K0D0Q3_IGNLU|nr:hypothetical protein ILUMI_11171 [Ignelater luminosus]
MEQIDINNNWIQLYLSPLPNLIGNIILGTYRVNHQHISEATEKLLYKMTEEHFFGMTFTADDPFHLWYPELIDEHTRYHKLILKRAVLDPSATPGELNVIELTVLNTRDGFLTTPVAVLNQSNNQVALNLSIRVPLCTPLNFDLSQGDGPVYLTGLHIIKEWGSANPRI